MQHFFGVVGWNKEYSIEFKGLAEGLHLYDFQITNTFFKNFENSTVEKGEIQVLVKLEKRSTFLKLHLKLKGWVELNCDRCLEDYRQKVKHKTELYVKFGDEQTDKGDNVIWILPEEHKINLAQVIYAYISLSIPLRHVHPKDSDGKRSCNREMIEKLNSFKSIEKQDDAEHDPRWDALKKLKNIN